MVKLFSDPENLILNCQKIINIQFFAIFISLDLKSDPYCKSGDIVNLTLCHIDLCKNRSRVLERNQLIEEIFRKAHFAK
jgi:hypothetical protein